MRRIALLALAVAPVLGARSLAAQPVFFSTGDVDGRIGIGARPGSAGKLEIEAGDDFVLGRATRLTSASFTGLVPANFTPGDAIFSRVQIYQVFPNNSTNPPSGRVPTRVNSPADNALLFRETGAGLTFTSAQVAPTFTAANSVLNGINALPGTTTGGEGAVTGQEVRFDVTFTNPIFLDAGHYFFVPQIGLTNGEFYWLSSVRPIVPPGTMFAPDLQSWIRNEDLVPDWVRVGTDIVGAANGGAAPTFNQAFSLVGTETPEPSSFVLAATGLAVAGWTARRRRAR
jgi:hypothetical protein